MEKMPFGKHKGKSLDDIDTGYLDWLIGEEWVEKKFPVLYHAICEYLKNPAVERELEDEMGD
mgnify:CR=1 FL=1